MRMRIDSLDFGRITIAGQTYTTDVLVFPDGRVQDHWWRTRGHLLCAEDLAPLMAAKPAEIVVGTGIYGRMRPAGELVSDLGNQGVRLTLLPNAEARTHYNHQVAQGAEGRRLAACFHLTC
jgi:hypothetical protein